jgi:hypothetical protein
MANVGVKPSAMLSIRLFDISSEEFPFIDFAFIIKTYIITVTVKAI